MSWVSVWKDKVGRQHFSLAALLTTSLDSLLQVRSCQTGLKRSLREDLTKLVSFVKHFGSLCLKAEEKQEIVII